MGGVVRASCFYLAKHGQKYRGIDFRKRFVANFPENIMGQHLKNRLRRPWCPLGLELIVPFTRHDLKGLLLPE